MLEILQAGKISISVEYKRVKTMRLTVYPPDGQVRISAPMHTDLRMIQEFVLSRLPWIEKHREKMLNQSREGNSFTDGEIHHIWGQPFTIKIVQHQGYPR
jgi:predicted metal-dependent hydrolase